MSAARAGATIRVVVCDDEQLLREALARLVDAAADLEVVATAANGAEAVSAALEHRPTWS